MTNCDEECDDGNSADEDYCNNDCDRYGKLVFVTKGAWTGKMGGLAGADTLCDEAAEAAALPPGEYMAWLSDTNPDTSPAAAFFSKDRPYYLTDMKTRVAKDFDDLATQNGMGYIEHAINLTEYPEQFLGEDEDDKVWTATYQNGKPASTEDQEISCAGWMTDNFKSGGGVGDPNEVGQGWSQAQYDVLGESYNTTHLCIFKRHLYCFEQ